ncbi:MAG: aldo/keto reductase [Clostridia bacterium]|nr:aldo/keto reductase [Clostridia bacterium]
MEKYFELKNGVRVPNIGYGTWRVPESQACVESVLTAIDCGYRHIDTAYFYKNERSIGEAVKNSGIHREDLFITSKLWNDFHGYESTLKVFEESLRNLDTDYLDLYLIHWPNPVKFRDDWAKSNAETWRAFEKLYRDGRIRAIGISNFLPHHIDELLKTAEIIPMVNQIELQPGLNRNIDCEYNAKLGIQLEAWAPFRIGESLNDPTVCKIAEKHSKTPAQIVLRWFLQKGIIPLPKSVTPERILSNIQVYDFELSDEDMTAINSIEQHPMRHDPDKIDF